ncbi:MAG: hypothetical protein ACI8R9_002195, partial [Paraglaciecola sp.]
VQAIKMASGIVRLLQQDQTLPKHQVTHDKSGYASHFSQLSDSPLT